MVVELNYWVRKQEQGKKWVESKQLNVAQVEFRAIKQATCRSQGTSLSRDHILTLAIEAPLEYALCGFSIIHD